MARDGIFPRSPKCLNTYAPFESALEALGHLHLSVDLRIQKYVCQPPPLHYWMPRANGGQDKREYTPDFVALTRDERVLVIDAKASYFALDEKWTSREPYIRAAYRRDHNADLVIWTERDLEAEPRRSNARTLYRHRFAPENRALDYSIRVEVEKAGGAIKLGSLCDRVSAAANAHPSDCFSAVMRLALAGEICLAPQQLYGRETLVTYVGGEHAG